MRKRLLAQMIGVRILIAPSAVLDGRFRPSKMPYNDLRRVSSAEVDSRRCNELQFAAAGKIPVGSHPVNAEVAA